MRGYQTEIFTAIVNKRDWAGSNVVVKSTKAKTKVTFYGNVIGVIDHVKRTYKVDNCGYNTASTTARINAIKMACNDYYGYKMI